MQPFVTDNRKGNFVFVRFFCIFTPTNKIFLPCATKTFGGFVQVGH